MSTLFDQPERHRYDYKGVYTLEECKDLLAGLLGKTPSAEAIVALYRAEIEKAKLSAYIANGDAFDEQLAGFGDLFVTLNRVLDEIRKEISE